MSIGRARRERGAAAVTALALVGALATVAVLLAHLAGALVTSRRAASAADLAALAGATAVQQGKDGCRAAAWTARRNHAALSSCSLQGQDVLVVVQAPTPALLGTSLAVSARARAGPP